MIRKVKKMVYNTNEKVIVMLQSINERMYNQGNIGPLPFDTMVAQLKLREE